jgi:hypothetical protein
MVQITGLIVYRFKQSDEGHYTQRYKKLSRSFDEEVARNLNNLCATSVSSVSLWLRFLLLNPPQRHGEHGGGTENRARLRRLP